MYLGVSVSDACNSFLDADSGPLDVKGFGSMEFGNGSQVFSHAKRIRLGIADDHPLVILAIERLAGNFPNVEVVSRSANSTQLEESLARGECDVAIIDFFMPGGRHGDGIEVIQQGAVRPVPGHRGPVAGVEIGSQSGHRSLLDLSSIDPVWSRTPVLALP